MSKGLLPKVSHQPCVPTAKTLVSHHGASWPIYTSCSSFSSISATYGYTALALIGSLSQMQILSFSCLLKSGAQTKKKKKKFTGEGRIEHLAFHTTLRKSLSISEPKHWPTSISPLELHFREPLFNQRSAKIFGNEINKVRRQEC